MDGVTLDIYENTMLTHRQQIDWAYSLSSVQSKTEDAPSRVQT